MRFKSLLTVAMLVAFSGMALADDDYNELKQQGYKDWKVTTIKKDFTGCKKGEVIKFDNGMSFKCSENEDHEVKDGNKVTILRHPSTGMCRVFIGDEDYEGQLMGIK